MIPQLKGDYCLATPRPFTAAAAHSSGDVIVRQTRVGVVLDDVASGDDGVFIVGTDPNGIEMPKATGAIAADAKVYWDEDGNPVDGDAGSGAVTTTSTSNLYLGRAAQASASGDALAVVELTNE